MSLQQPLQQIFDYIVVGGGSAGCVVAGRLAESNAGSVLLIEGGGHAEANPETLSAEGFRDAFANDRVMLDRMSAPQPQCGNRTLYAGSGRGMGGGGAVNGMVYTRGDKLDFAQWPAGWQWSDVEPVFQQLELRLRPRHREATTFTEIALTAAEAVGFRRKHGLNDGELNGFMGYNDMNFEGDRRRHSYVAFVAEQNSGNLTIQTHCVTQRVLFDDHRATGVEVIVDGRTQSVSARKGVILCAGALETPKLLMLSGIGPRAHLESLGIPVIEDIPAIGSNLQDHLNATLLFQGRRPVDFGHPQVYGFRRCNFELDLPPQQADVCFAWLAAPKTLQRTMKRMGPATVLRGKRFFNPVLRGAVRGLVALMLLLPFINEFINKLYGIVVILGKPLSRGTVRLASTDARDAAIVDLGYYTDSADVRTVLNGVAVARDIAAQTGLRSWGSKPLASALRSEDRKALEAWIRNSAMTTYHYCGTCRMGEAADAPVDAQLQLKGFSHITVADASVMPVIPVSALNAPSMMIGYRAADFIMSKESAGILSK